MNNQEYIKECDGCGYTKPHSGSSAYCNDCTQPKGELVLKSEVRKMLRNYSMNHTFIDTKELPMYNKIQLAALKLFGDKTLSEGCIIKALMFGNEQYFTCIGMRKITDGVGIYQYDKFEMDGVPMEILGHEPSLFPDVAIKLEEKEMSMVVSRFDIIICGKGSDEIDAIPYYPTLPLLSQPHLYEIINLFSK